MEDTGGMPWDKLLVPVLRYEYVYLVCQSTALSGMCTFGNRYMTCRKVCGRPSLKAACHS